MTQQHSLGLVIDFVLPLGWFDTMQCFGTCAGSLKPQWGWEERWAVYTTRLAVWWFGFRYYIDFLRMTFTKKWVQVSLLLQVPKQKWSLIMIRPLSVTSERSQWHHYDHYHDPVISKTIDPLFCLGVLFFCCYSLIPGELFQAVTEWTRMLCSPTTSSRWLFQEFCFRATPFWGV